MITSTTLERHIFISRGRERRLIHWDGRKTESVPVGRFQLEGLKIPSAALRTSEVGVYVEKEKERTLQVCHAPRLEPWQTRVQHVTVGRRDIYGNINRTFLARRFQLAPSKSNSKHQVNKQSLLIKLSHSRFYYLIEIFYFII